MFVLNDSVEVVRPASHFTLSAGDRIFSTDSLGVPEVIQIQSPATSLPRPLLYLTYNHRLHILPSSYSALPLHPARFQLCLQPLSMFLSKPSNSSSSFPLSLCASAAKSYSHQASVRNRDLGARAYSPNAPPSRSYQRDCSSFQGGPRAMRVFLRHLWLWVKSGI